MEEFFTAHRNTFQALAALGTWAAVILSLWLALAQRKQDIRGSLYIRSDGALEAQLTSYFSERCLYWTAPWILRGYYRSIVFQFVKGLDFKREFNIDPLQSIRLVVHDNAPIGLPPIREKLLDKFSRWIFPFIKLKVLTLDGSEFTLAVTREVREYLVKGNVKK